VKAVRRRERRRFGPRSISVAAERRIKGRLRAKKEAYIRDNLPLSLRSENARSSRDDLL
jgi:hypothetical protein